MINSQHLVDEYAKWIRENTTLGSISGAIEITTPFLDRHNDHLQIYVTPVNGDFELTDDGYILADLEACGCPIDTSRRSQILETILRGFGIRQENGRLFVVASKEQFSAKKHALLQAMLAVNDMFMTSKRQVKSLFVDDVANLLDGLGIRYVRNVSLTGHSGLVHPFEFVIPRSRNAPERLVSAINEPSKSTVSSLIFSWTDTKSERQNDSSLFVFLNDSGKPVDGSLLAALREYDIKPVSWNRREEFYSYLSA